MNYCIDEGPIRIMPLGDSLTRGLYCGGRIPGGYRTRLYQRLSMELHPLIKVTFVGSATDNPDPNHLPCPNHEGHGGQCIDEALSQIESWTVVPSERKFIPHLDSNGGSAKLKVEYIQDKKPGDDRESRIIKANA